MIAMSNVWLFTLNWLHLKWKIYIYIYSSSVSLPACPVSSSHMRPAVSILGSVSIENISTTAESSVGYRRLRRNDPSQETGASQDSVSSAGEAGRKTWATGCHFLLFHDVVDIGAMQMACEEYSAGHGRGPPRNIPPVTAWSAANGGWFPLRCPFHMLVWHALLPSGFTLCICHKNCFQKKQEAWQDKKLYKKGILWFIYVKFMEDDRRHCSSKISCHSRAINPAGQKLKEWVGNRDPWVCKGPWEIQTRLGISKHLHRGAGPAIQMRSWHLLANDY